MTHLRNPDDLDIMGLPLVAPDVAKLTPMKKELGQNPKDLLGIKKVDLTCIPPAGEIHMARAMMDGANKYGAYNWRENKVVAKIYIAAARRHLLQFLDGEDYDPKSTVHHLGHAMACCAIILDAMETGNLIDDRPVKGKASEILERYTQK